MSPVLFLPAWQRVYNESMAKTTTAQSKTTKRKLVIPKDDKKIAGVCAAFANYLDIDVTIIRILWVLLLLPGGLPGLIPYLICWLVIPEEK